MSVYTTEELFQEEVCMANYSYLESKNNQLFERMAEINSKLPIAKQSEFRSLLKEFARLKNDCNANIAEMNSLNLQLLLLHDK